jgi:hypothetical protein
LALNYLSNYASESELTMPVRVIDEYSRLLLSNTSPPRALNLKVLVAALSHNDLLSETEQRSIRTLISTYETDLNHLNSEIARVQATLDALVSQREKTVAQIDSCQLAVAPHRKLPNELLAEIFVHSDLEVSIPVRKGPGGTLRTTPYNVLLVCSRWKHVILGVPKLRNSLKVDLDRCSPSNVRHLTKITSEGGLSPLSLAIRCHQQSSFFSQTMRDLVISPECRLQNLTLDIGTLSPLVLYELSPGVFNCLEAVSIIIDTPPSTYSTRTIALLQAAPKLSDFTLTFTAPYAYWFSPSVFLLPWTQLTNLHVSGKFMMSPSNAHAILRQCHSLISCKISIAAKDSSDSVFRLLSPTVLPTLRKLQLSIQDEACTFLRDFVFPGLISLELECPYISIPSSWEMDFCPFISCSSGLQSLEIHQIIQESMVQNVLQEVPMLTSFLLGKGNLLTSGTLAMITNGSLVPRLEHLTCHVEWLSDALDMLESRLTRNGGCATVRNTSIFFQKACMDWIWRLERLRNRGVDIVATYFPSS